MEIDLETRLYFDREIYNIILIHSARAWERTRVRMPSQTMPLDNIQSTEAIEEIATEINEDDIIQRFLLERDGDIWLETEQSMSDIYIEHLAIEIINRDYYCDVSMEEGHKCHKCGSINTHNQDDFSFCNQCLTHL
jgi:hypothetical protein